MLDDFVETASHGHELVKRYARLVYLVGKFKATYPSEVSKHTGLKPDIIGKAFYKLEQQGILERLYADLEKPDPRLLDRRPDMIKAGIRGTERWSRMHWVGLADNMVITRSDGVKIDPYGNPVPEDKYGGYRSLNDEIRKALEADA